MKFGCHISIREGYTGAAKQALRIGAHAFQYFPKNPRSLSVKDFNRIDAARCKDFCKEHGILSVAHTPYPTSLTPSTGKKEEVITSLLNDLEIAEACGSVGVVVHFGSRIDPADPLTSYHLMIDMLDLTLNQWEGECKVLLENNAGKPGTMGTTLEELVQIKKLAANPEKIGFCFDTCHAYSSGLWSGEMNDELWEKGSELGYVQDIEVIHLNNSKYPLKSGKDRHANIFKGGHIEESSFKRLFEMPFLSDVPFILETPSDAGISHAKEIAMLNEKLEK